MLFSTIFATILPFILFNPTAAQSLNPNSSLTVVCIAGQCIQGTTNLTLGATLEIPSSSSSSQSPILHILPGTYTTTTNPQLLHNYLTNPIVSLNPLPSTESSSSSSSSSSSGFSNISSIFNNNRDLPLNFKMSPGITIFQGIKYSGNAGYSGFPENPEDVGSGEVNDGVEMNVSSFSVSEDVFLVVSTGTGIDSERVVFWESVPDIHQLPFSSSSSSSSSSADGNDESTTKSLLLIDIHSTTCNPTCSSNSICSPTTHQCICSPGFTGTSCESCSPGHFGPECKPCPSLGSSSSDGSDDSCEKCDEGIQGTGICLKKKVVGKPEECGCVNGVCKSDGSCSCITGWKDQDGVSGAGTSGGKCSKCQDGFYLTSSGNCQVCQPGCEKCADTTGSCTSCQQGFSINSLDSTKCDFIKQPTSSGQSCPDGSFSDGSSSSCKQCSSACRTCSGVSSNDCVLCAVGRYFVDGNCVEVSTSGDGVCQGTNGMVADNVGGKCEACPAKCTSCKIPGFSATSTIDQVQCTGCLPGSVLSEGKCVESCPSGTFLSPQDNLTCLPCDSSCGTCTDSATFCLTCSSSSQFAFQGKCIATCPQNTFTSTSSSSLTCLPCHGDCATCSGSQFNQCTSCPSKRPVLKDGRCLASCSKNSFLDSSGGENGNGTCSSCNGDCATCDGKGDDRCLSCPQGKVLRKGKCVDSQDGCETIQGLGVCLNELVIVPKPDSNDGNNGGTSPPIDGISDPTTADRNGNNKLEWWQIVLMVLGVLFIVLVVVVIWRRWMRKKRMVKTRDWARDKGVLRNSWWRRMFTSRVRRNGNTKVPRPLSLKGSRSELPRFREDEKRSHRLGEDESMNVIDYYGDREDDMSRVTSWRRTTTIGNQSLFSEITGERRRVPEPREPVRHRSLRSTRSNWVDSEAAKYARTIRSERMGDLKSNNPFVRR